MSRRIELVTNYDFLQRFQLTLNGSPFDMADATQVSVALIDPADDAVILNSIVQSSSLEGANWALSLVAIHLSEAVTAAIQAALITKYGYCETELLLEIRVERDGFSEPWQFRPIAIVKGYMTT